jgi:hypothetical protein
MLIRKPISDVMDAGIKVSFPGLKHLLWDEVFEKL